MTGSIGTDEYVISMSGRTSGLARVVASGEGSMTATGAVSAGKLLPSRYTSKSTADDDTLAVTMTFKDGNVNELEASEPPPGEDRVVLTTEHRRQVLDPLSALLIPAGDGGVSEAACRRVLPVFDGRRRYDLSLSFKRIEQVKASQGYAGPAAVCSVAFQPIAGHRRSSPLLDLSHRRPGRRNGARPHCGHAPPGPISHHGHVHARQCRDAGDALRGDCNRRPPTRASQP